MLYKIKLINKKNLVYVIFITLYKLFKFSLFYKISVVFFKKNILPINSYKFFLKKIKIHKINLFKYKKNNIIEIGGGNFFGLFPIFLKENCKEFINVDPYIPFDPSKSNFLFKIFCRRIEKFKKIVSGDLLKFHQTKNILDVKKKNNFDIVVSLSCLEHVENLEKLFLKLSKITRKKHTQLHIINFSNHISKSYPFKYLYDANPKDFKKKFKNNLNFKKIPDYEKILKKYKFNYKFFVIDKINLNDLKINSYWKKKYSKETLKIRTAILFIDCRK